VRSRLLLIAQGLIPAIPCKMEDTPVLRMFGLANLAVAQIEATTFFCPFLEIGSILSGLAHSYCYLLPEGRSSVMDILLSGDYPKPQTADLTSVIAY